MCALCSGNACSAEFKAKVALEALKGWKTINEIASDTGVHPNLIGLWKKQALEELPQIFSNRKIGQLKVELDAREKN